MVERARETAAVVSQRWRRVHARALRSLSPPSLDKAGDDERSKAHALINLQLAFLFVCCMYSVVALFIDGTLLTDNGIVFFLSFTFYATNLLVYRRWGNLYAAAMLLLVFLEHLIMVKSYLDGLHSEAFYWAILLPQLVFFLLGQRPGAFFLGMTLVHTIILYLIQGLLPFYADGVGDPLFGSTATAFIDGVASHHHLQGNVADATVVMWHMDGDIGGEVDGWCGSPSWLSAFVPSKGNQSPHGIFINRIALLVLVSSFAFFHENRRSLALRQIEETLREKEAVNASLLQATEAKTNFLANMSHELRTPMHGIIAMASDLKEMPLPSKAREAIGIISDCADHLLSLVNDVLDFARIEQSQLELEQIPFCMTSEVKKALAMHSVIAKQKGVYLLVRKVRVSFPYHTGDPLRFRQIIINLLSNAIKFTPAGGQVSVSVVNKKSKPEIIHVSVQDTGIGIPKSSQPHLFESFSQLDASVRRKYGGSGLGLSICKKLCEAMGGEIECRSEVGKGSDFSFYVSLPPTTKQNYREAREGDESDSATRQRHHPLATPPDVSADEQKQIDDDDDDDELMESDDRSDSDLDSDSSSGSSDDSIGEHHLNDDDCDSEDGDFEIEDEDEALLDKEHRHGKSRDSAVARRHSSSSMLTKSLTITPVRRTSRHSSGGPDLGRMIASASRRHKTDGGQGQNEADEERGRSNRRRVKRSSGRRASSPASTTAVLAAASASVAETVDSRRRMSASGGGPHHHKRSSMLVNARRASEQHGMTMRGAVEQHQPLRLMSSGRGYVADDDNDDWFLAAGGSSSHFSSASSSLSLSSSASSSALSSPSSSFCSSSEISLPPLSESTAAAAARQRAAHFMMASSMDSNPQGLGDSSIPAAEATSAVLAGLRRGSVPAFGMSPTHRLLSSPSLTSMNPHHASMPTIPSLSSASDSPLPSPSLPPLPLNSSGAPPPSPSPSFSATLASASSNSSSALSMSSAQHLLPTVGSRHLSLNSCASPRGIPRVRTSTPPRPSTPHGALFLPRSSGGTPPVPQLSLSKLGAKSAERGQSPSIGAPRSFYVPSFPPEAMLASPRGAPSSSAAATPQPRSTEEVYQDVMRGKRILVVEDNLINQKVALKMLSSFDCKVTVAENGLVAIKLFEESYREERRKHENGEPLFHAILMDIQMPVIDGFETAIRIRELEAQFNEAEAARHQQLDGLANGSQPGRKPQAVPIIALTASATKEYQQKCLAKGMNCFLSKPLKKETLVRTLTDVIKQAGYYDEAAELARRRAEEERARQLVQEEAEMRARMQRQREIEELREKRKAREQATIMMMMGMAATNAMMAMNKLQHGGGDREGNDADGISSSIGDDGELTRRRMVELLRTKGRSRHVKHNSIG